MRGGSRRVARRTSRRVSRRAGAADESLGSNEQTSESTTEELERLFRLKEQGAITEEEYEQKKRELI